MRLHFIPDYAGRLISRGHGRHSVRVIGNWELILVLESELEMFIGKTIYSVHPGECLLLPPGIRHGGLSVYPPNLSFFWIHFLPENAAAEKWIRACPNHFPAAYPARLSEYFQLYLSLQSDRPDDPAGLELVLLLILHEAFCSKQKEKTVSGSPLPSLVERTRNILTLRFREPLSTAQIAAELQCNPDYLGRIYRKFMQETIMGTLIRIRLNHAAALLRGTVLTVSQTAYETGFNDPGYFRRCFFRHFAVSPKNYRRLKSPGHVNTE